MNLTLNSINKFESELSESPSKVTDKYWLYAKRQSDTYPLPTENSGKWLIFVPLTQIDTVWTQIKSATELGHLGSSSKVSTAKQNPNSTNSSDKVICVHTYDWTDKDDVMRIRQNLRQLGILSKIPYKSDNDTHAGKYVNRGNKRISKYYE